MEHTSYISLAIFFLFISCEKKNDCSSQKCDEVVVIDAGLYEHAPSDDLTINSIVIENNCLTIDFSSSGCDGSTWELKLIDAGIILESYPPQRNLRLSLKNEELCNAYFSKKISFDVSQLKFEGSAVYLNVKDYPDAILY